ncbi:MAG: DUF4384 domain-containing protein [Bacteroides sp.]|nr:DUF4384 domain-containing protein [Bacteroides sp.]
MLLPAVLMAQEVKEVRVEYTYHASEDVSPAQAKRTALERAKIQAIADEFGTVVTQANTTFISNENGKSDVDFFSLGESEVKGEWIETTEEPKYEISYGNGMLAVKVTLAGRIREIQKASIDFKAEVLRNGTDLKFAATDFRNGDDMYLYFQSPADGFLAVYLLDEVTQNVYCLLPYKHSTEAVMPVRHDTSYLLFSAEHGGKDAAIVDEYTLSCTRQQEQNTLYIIFSPNEFAKATSSDKAELLPRELSFEAFQKWLVKSRSRDNSMCVDKRNLTIRKK